MKPNLSELTIEMTGKMMTSSGRYSNDNEVDVESLDRNNGGDLEEGS